MEIEETIRKSTCRVDFEEGQGSGFWVDDSSVVTAAHVVNAAQSDTVTIQISTGERINAAVEKSDPIRNDGTESDLALLSLPKTPEEIELLDLNADIPSIGSEVVWSGYALLPGESRLDRQRFGWGKVASQEYGDKGTFFEVDGLFNPSHSGGPVVDQNSGKVVGVVSASAGEFEELQQQWFQRTSALRAFFNFYQKES